MTRQEYMEELKKYLKRLPQEDFDNAIEYFSEYFEEAGPEKEQQVMRELGEPKEAARELFLNLLQESVEKDQDIVEEKAPVDAEYGMIQDAMCYQIGKEIGAMAAVLKGKVDAILLTGGIAYGKPITDYITRMVGFIAPVKVYPGEDEMRALAMNGLMVLRGEMQAKTYA